MRTCHLLSWAPSEGSGQNKTFIGTILAFKCVFIGVCCQVMLFLHLVLTFAIFALVCVEITLYRVDYLLGYRWNKLSLTIV